jgi:hypothetical protein
VDPVDFSVAEFFDELFPRLRSFHLEGAWPETADGTDVDGYAIPLPLLEDLKWCGWRVINVPRQLMGARPSTLNTSDEALVEWLQIAHGAGADSATVSSPLGRVRALTLRLGDTQPTSEAMALFLREAPHLRQLTFDVWESEHALWVLSRKFSPVPAFAELGHPGLRHVAVSGEHSPSSRVDVPVPGRCGVRLRQRHFPRLRRLSVDDVEYPVWAEANSALTGRQIPVPHVHAQ